jgi:hypothetical protein
MRRHNESVEGSGARAGGSNTTRAMTIRDRCVGLGAGVEVANRAGRHVANPGRSSLYVGTVCLSEMVGESQVFSYRSTSAAECFQFRTKRRGPRARVISGLGARGAEQAFCNVSNVPSAALAARAYRGAPTRYTGADQGGATLYARASSTTVGDELRLHPSG